MDARCSVGVAIGSRAGSGGDSLLAGSSRRSCDRAPTRIDKDENSTSLRPTAAIEGPTLLHKAPSKSHGIVNRRKRTPLVTTLSVFCEAWVSAGPEKSHGWLKGAHHSYRCTKCAQLDS